MNSMLYVLMYFYLFISSEEIGLNKNIDFALWKKNTIELCQEKCESIEDNLYSKECSYLKEDIKYIDISDLDSLYKLACKAIPTDDDIELKYYIHYFFSGEVNDVYYFYIFKSKCGEYIVVKFILTEQGMKIENHKKISKRILFPKSNIKSNNGIGDDFGIVTEFKDLEIKSNTIIFSPKLSFYENLMEL